MQLIFNLVFPDRHAIAKQFGVVAGGDVIPSQRSRTKLAKSVLDADQLQAYVLAQVFWQWRGRLRSRTLRPSQPNGITSLRNRECQCDECKAMHHAT
jgi:hypothetical protein